MFELPADIRAELERAGAGDQPSAEDQTRVQQLLAAKLGSSEARSAGPPPSAASIGHAALGVGTKLWLGAIAVGIATTLLAVRAGPVTRKGPARESELAHAQTTIAAGARESNPTWATTTNGLNAIVGATALAADAAQTRASNAAAERAAGDVRSSGSDATRAQHAAPANARAIASAAELRRYAAANAIRQERRRLAAAPQPAPAIDDDTTHAAANDIRQERRRLAAAPQPAPAIDDDTTHAAANAIRQERRRLAAAPQPAPAIDDDTTHAAANATRSEAWQAALTPQPTAAGDLALLSAAEVPTRPSAGREPSSDQLARELPLLRGASRALERDDAAGALHWVQEHAARFQHGFLSEEREALRIIALCRLDRSAEASALRKRFASQLAHSPLRARIARQCANAAGPLMQ